MSIYDPYLLFEERMKAEKEEVPLIYNCPVCRSGINLNWQLSPDTFRDDLSYKEFTISGLCQKCQDSVFGKQQQKIIKTCPKCAGTGYVFEEDE